MSRIIFVVGMHRIGTSALTRGLRVLGVEIGDNQSARAVDRPEEFLACLVYGQTVDETIGCCQKRRDIASLLGHLTKEV